MLALGWRIGTFVLLSIPKPDVNMVRKQVIR